MRSVAVRFMVLAVGIGLLACSAPRASAAASLPTASAEAARSSVGKPETSPDGASLGEETGRDEPPQTIKLEDLIREALQRSPGLHAKQHAYEAARDRVLAAWLPHDPEIGVDVEGQSSLFHFDRTDNEYSVVQTVPFPTTLWLQGLAAMRESQMAFQRYQEERRNIVWHLEQPYYDLYVAKKTSDVLEEISSLTQKLLRVTQARYESNQASQPDLLKAQIEFSKLAIDRFNWQQKVHVAEAHVSHILNRSLDTRYALAEEPRSAPFSSSPGELEGLAVQTRPELKALELGIKRAKLNRALAVTEWLPSLTGRIEARQFSGEGHIREYDTFLGVTVPVWSLLKGVGGGWQSARHDVQAAEALYTAMKNEVLLAIHEAYAKATSAEHAVHIYETLIVPQAKQQVEVTLAAYEAGRADFFSLLDAQRTLKDTQIAYHTFRADYERGLSDVRLAVGEAWEGGPSHRMDHSRDDGEPTRITP